ncbi:MAG TPA: SGNH/GDSL hydrolase family protein [Acidimicrobiia bacterium]|nr:SGNH/GDSL hydrolase family protein [Acidimicrobiia bacterium]
MAGRVRLGLAGAAGFPAAAVAAAGAVAAQYWYVAHRPLPSFHDLDANGVFGPDTLPEVRIALLGDSTVTGPGLESRTDLWSHQVARRLALEHHVRLLSLAVGGSRVRDVLAGQVPDALALEPHLAVVSVGANDAMHGTSMRRVESDLDAIVAAFGEAGTVVVLAGLGDLGNIPRLSFPLKALASRRSRAVDRVHARVAARHGHAVKVPIAQRCDEFFRSVDAFSPDMFHPNRAGHAVWADAAYPAIAAALARARV